LVLSTPGSRLFASRERYGFLLAPVGLEKDNAKLIARVNGLAGHDYPRELGGKVTPPRGLVITGDLTEWGRKHEWARFVEMFGLTGKEGMLKLPVFEMVGNHDTVDNGPWISEQVAARHGGRFYAWDWDDLHLIALGEAPGPHASSTRSLHVDGVPASSRA
jgi:3',5'-cyclic AMP phosphodiesterase CpdA